MFITRRKILALAGSALVPGGLSGARTTSPLTTYCRKYTASATITVLSIPIFSKSGVGSGYTVIEEAGPNTAIQFGAGSWPEAARGLNRLGYIQETIVRESTTEAQPGKPSDCSYVAFITTSQEKNLDQAKKALEASSGVIPYSAAQGYSRNGRIASRVDRLQFSSHLTWRDIPALVGMARQEIAANATPLVEMQPLSTAPGTFLYTVRAALLNPDTKTRGQLFFNSKQFLLETEKDKDAAAGAHFADKKIVQRVDAVMKLSAVLTERRTGEKTPFRLWYEAGAEQMPPLRFDYQAKSFLRLTFEVDEAANVPPIRFAFAGSKENA